jgi:hypothetical protein
VTVGIFGALVQYVATGTGLPVWLNRTPEQTLPSQNVLPYIDLEGDFTTEWNEERSVVDVGDVTFKCFAVGGATAEAMGEQVKALFGDPAEWAGIPIQGKRFFEVSRSGFGLHTEDEPDAEANVVYRYEVRFHVQVSGSS